MQIKNWLEPYKNKSMLYLQRLSEPRFAGQVVFIVIVLMITWSGVKAVQNNYNLQKQITALKQQNELQKLQNDNLALQNQYFNSNQYLELSARQNLGLASPGEKEVVVPASVAKSYETPLPSSDSTDAKAKQPAYQRNFQSWVNFFLHRQNSGS
jgi:cell division protein FtsB